MGSEGELKRGFASLIKLLPPPFIREGDKGGEVNKQSHPYIDKAWN